eukprot:GILK01007877.1.p1 GENE.GILK01007877.1~~GILK01007877.1.p1  ORF type:complete len:366 (+),score=34.25 GILK01007877.1:49-1098(+)
MAMRTAAPLSRVLLVSKTPNVERISRTRPDLIERLTCERASTAVRQRLESLRASEATHTNNVKNMKLFLESRGIPFQEVKDLEVETTQIESVDLVVSLGGDGTFLKAASLIRDQTPLLGINTDSQRSAGALCRWKLNTQQDFPDLLHKLLTGDFSYKTRHRIRADVINEKEERITVDHYALNEIYLGEVEPSRASSFTLSVDGQPKERERGGGLLVSTASGYSGWMKSACHPSLDSIREVLELAETAQDTTALMTQAEAVARRFYEKYNFATHEDKLFYFAREQIKAVDQMQRYSKGFCDALVFESFCWDGFLSMDGMRHYPLNFGDRVYISVATDFPVRTIELSQPER